MKAGRAKQPEIKFDLQGKSFTAPYFTFCSFSTKFRENFDYKEYKVKTKVPETTFKGFLDACKGFHFFIDENNFLDLIKLCNEFECPGIREDIIKYMENYKKESIIKNYSELVMNESNEYEAIKLANEIAGKLDLYIDEESLLTLSSDELSKILFNENRNENVNESQIFNVIKQKVEKYQGDSKELYSHLNLRELDEDSIQSFFDIPLKELPQSFDTECFLPLLIEYHKSNDKLKERLNTLEKVLTNYNQKWEDDIGPIKKQIKDHEQWKEEKKNQFIDLKEKNKKLSEDYQILRQKFIELNTGYKKIIEDQVKYDEDYAKSNPFKGIVYDIKKKNEKIEDFIKIKTPDNTYSKKYNPYDLFDYDDARINNCYYHNLKKDKKNTDNWIDFCFEKEQYKLFGISIRTSCFGQCFSHPKEFKIMGSNDEKQWEDIFEANDDKNQFLNGSCLSYTYLFDRRDVAYKYIRFLQTDAHFEYKDRYGIMALSAIEFFGKKDQLNQVELINF